MLLVDTETKPLYTLHYFPFSLDSLTVRFGLVLGETLNPGMAPRVRVRLVNLHREEHLSEPYLTLVNTKGEVPVLTSPALPASLNDGRSISAWLCEMQPELMPEEHEEDVARLMGDICSLQVIPLISTAEDRQWGVPNGAAALLEKNGLSAKHRRALEINSVFHDFVFNGSLDPDKVVEAEEQAHDFMQDLVEVLNEPAHLRKKKKPWLFGGRPTILDAHVTVLAARLMDVDRTDLLPDEVQAYARGVMATPEWNKATAGRRTVWDESLGEVADFDVL